jgi:hypothetical protein
MRSKFRIWSTWTTGQFLGLTICAALAQPLASQAAIEIDRVESGTVYFKASEGDSAPEPLKTDLVDITPLGSLAPKAGAPFFLVAADPCKSCGQDRSLYLLKPPQGRQATFVYPGKIIDSKTRVVLLESRAFYGRCIPGKGDVYVSFQKERIPKKRRTSVQESVYVAEIEDGKLEDKLLHRDWRHRAPSIDTALRRVRAKECREVEGRSRMTKPLGQLKHVGDEEEEEDDEDPKAGDPVEGPPTEGSAS